MKRAVAYCRVSTKSKAQIHSLEYQTSYWQDKILSDSGYEYVGIYSDNGISGRSMNKRPQLLRMLDDAKANKFDVIFTKSIARFARNVEELLTVVRQLRDAGIQVFFEKEQIDTFDPNSELFLTVGASIAENDIKIYAENQTWANREKFSNGFITVGPQIYGYRMRNEDNTLVIVPEEAAVVKQIYQWYLDGDGMQTIANKLNALGIGNKEWHRAAISYILKNEKYKGCALMQKTFKVNGAQKKNAGQVKQYYMEQTHEPIISPEDFGRVQQLRIERAVESEFNQEMPRYPFTKKIRCGVCGSGFVHKIQNCNKPYHTEIWACTKKEAHGMDACCSTRIKDSVLKEKFIECYNEFVEKFPDSAETVQFKQQLAELLEQERELYAMKINRMIEVSDYNREWGELKTKIDKIYSEISNREVRGVSRTDLVYISEFDAEKVDKFLDYVTMYPKKVEFTFMNGAKISRYYSNGASGNKKGWLERKKERMKQEGK